jgi:GH18 family chitinase
MVSVGGWSGSVAYSGMASSSANRAEFIQWNVDFIQQYGTDGVDLGMQSFHYIIYFRIYT